MVRGVGPEEERRWGGGEGLAWVGHSVEFYLAVLWVFLVLVRFLALFPFCFLS